MSLLPIRSVLEYAKEQGAISFAKKENVITCLEQYGNREDYEARPYAKTQDVCSIPIYYAKLHNVVVSGDNDGIVSLGEKACYLDDHIIWDRNHIDDFSTDFKLANNHTHAAVYIHQPKQVPRAISLLKMWSANYWHFQIESVSRLWQIDQDPRYDDWPLLIDEGSLAYESMRDILRYVNYKDRPVVVVKPNESVQAEELLWPSYHSWWWGAERKPNAYSMACDSDAIAWLKDKILCGLHKDGSYLVPGSDRRNVYIARGNNNRLVNEDEVVDLLRSCGFEIVYPARLTLAQQVKVYTEAKNIVTPSGTGLANIMYCQPDTTIYEIMPFEYQYMSFYQYAMACGVTLKCIDAELLVHGSMFNRSTFKVALDKLHSIALHCITE